ncbi:Uncharacterised protein g10502 [Pycnogonum litorale]
MNTIVTVMLVTALLIVLMVQEANLQRPVAQHCSTKCLCDNWSREKTALRSQITRYANPRLQTLCAKKYCRTTANTTRSCRYFRSYKCRTSGNRQCRTTRMNYCRPTLGLDIYGDHVSIIQVSGKQQRLQETVCTIPFKKCCDCSPEKRCIQNYRTIRIVGINLRTSRCGTYYLKSCCGCSCGTCCNPYSKYYYRG